MINRLKKSEFCKKSILDNYIEMWNSLASTGNVQCIEDENYLTVHSDVDDPGFNILIPKKPITLANLDLIKERYKIKRNNFTIMSPINYLVEVEEQLAPFFVQKMYGLARRTRGTTIFRNELSNELSFIEIFKNAKITQDWETILASSFSMTSLAAQQFVDILHSYKRQPNNFNHTVTYINENAASICSILYSSDLIHAGLYNGASLGRHSDHKPFVSIVNKHINDAYNNGYPWVVSQSTPSATRALTKYLGFKIMDVYSYYKIPLSNGPTLGI